MFLEPQHQSLPLRRLPYSGKFNIQGSPTLFSSEVSFNNICGKVVAWQLVPRTPERVVWIRVLDKCYVLGKNTSLLVSLSTQEFKRVPASYQRSLANIQGIGKERRRKVSKEKSQTSCHYMPQKQGEAPTGWPAASPFTP